MAAVVAAGITASPQLHAPTIFLTIFTCAEIAEWRTHICGERSLA